MKLSEAIRLGAMLKPQEFGDLNSGGKTCAWGSAYDACGYANIPKPFPAAWIWPQKELAVCPECVTHGGSGGFHGLIDGHTVAGHIITHLNDTHRWTRERIADWVEEQERAMEEKQPEIQETTA